MNIYRAAKRQGKYSPIIIKTEVNNCFSIISFTKLIKQLICASVMNIIYFLLKNVMIDHMTHDLNSKAVRQVRLTFHNNNETKMLKNVL